MPTAADNLAAIREAAASKRADERPIRRKLDDGVAIEIPGRRALAAAFVLPWLRQDFDVFRNGSVLLTRPKDSDGLPTGVNQLELVDDLRAALGALPDRPDANRPYNDLRHFLTYGDRDAVTAYLRDAARTVHLLATPYKSAARHAAPRTAATRKAAQREREHSAEVDSAAAWLALLLDDEDAELGEGSPVTAAALYELAQDAIEEFVDLEERTDEEDPQSPLYRLPGPRTFYAVADELLGPSWRGANGAKTYRVPSAYNIHRTRSLLRRRKYAAALLLQRDHFRKDAVK